MTEELSRLIEWAGQVPYRLAFKANVAGLAASNGDMPAAIKLALEALLIHPQFLPANELMATIRIIDGDFETAVLELDNILRIDPGSRFGNFGKTIMMCLTGKQQESLNGLLELTEDPELEEVGHYLLQRLLGVSKDSQLHGSMFQKLSNAIREGKTKTAHDLLGEIVDTKQNPRLQIVLSDILVVRGERKTAKRILEQLSDSHPDYPDMLYRLSKLELADSNKSRSADLLQTLVDIEPLYPDPEELLKNTVSAYTPPEDRQKLVDLRSWCFVVLEKLCFEQKPVFTEPQPEPEKELEPEQITIEIPEIQPQSSEPEPESEQETPQIFKLHDVEPIPEPVKETKEPPSRITDEPEPDKATEEIQLFRTRKILEEARKILDQTRVEVEHQKEVQHQKDIQAEAEAELQRQRELVETEEEKYEGPTLFDSLKEDSSDLDAPLQLQEEPVKTEPEANHVSDTSKDIEELPQFEEAPKRIVLPTSDEAPQITPERAWQLLRAGEAEEAFMMFSKLIRGER